MMDTSEADPAKRNRREITVDPSDNDLKLDMEEALRYVKVVKQHVNADKYQKFAKIVKDMLTDSIRPAEGVKMVKDILQGHPDLFLGFLCFVPKDLDKIDLPPSEEKPDYKDAVAFLCKIKSRFSGNVEKYRSFMNLLTMYLTDRKLAVEVYQEVTVLFQGHADLIQQFNYFMPNASRKVLSDHVSSMEPLGHRDGGGPSKSHGVRELKDKGKEKVIDQRPEDK